MNRVNDGCTSNNLLLVASELGLSLDLRLERLLLLRSSRSRIRIYLSGRGRSRLLRSRLSLRALRRGLLRSGLFSRGRLGRLGGLFRTRILAAIVRQARLIHRYDSLTTWEPHAISLSFFIHGVPATLANNRNVGRIRSLWNFYRRILLELPCFAPIHELKASCKPKLFSTTGVAGKCLTQNATRSSVHRRSRISDVVAHIGSGTDKEFPVLTQGFFANQCAKVVRVVLSGFLVSGFCRLNHFRGYINRSVSTLFRNRRFTCIFQQVWLFCVSSSVRNVLRDIYAPTPAHVVFGITISSSADGVLLPSARPSQGAPLWVTFARLSNFTT